MRCRPATDLLLETPADMIALQLRITSDNITDGTIATADLGAGVGGINWQSVKTSNFTAAAGEGYFINTTSGAIEMDLPAGSIGDEISFIDYAGTFDSNALTIDQNGTEKIAGSTDPLVVSTERAANTLVYVDSTQGWLLKNN